MNDIIEVDEVDKFREHDAAAAVPRSKHSHSIIRDPCLRFVPAKIRQPDLHERIGKNKTRCKREVQTTSDKMRARTRVRRRCVDRQKRRGVIIPRSCMPRMPPTASRSSRFIRISKPLKTVLALSAVRSRARLFLPPPVFRACVCLIRFRAAAQRNGSNGIHLMVERVVVVVAMKVQNEND